MARHAAIGEAGTTTARRFRPGWPLTLVTAAAALLLLHLGSWQLDRLAWKRDLIERSAARLEQPAVALPAHVEPGSGIEYRPVRAEGTLRFDRAQIYGVEARGGEVGGRLLVPLEREAGPAILVDMGWVPEPVDAFLARQRGVVEEGAEIVGYVRFDHRESAPLFRPDNEPAERRWYWKDTGALARVMRQDGLAAFTLVRLAGNGSAPQAAGAAPPVPAEPRIDYRNNHLGYAVTWFGLCAGLIGVYIAFGLARGRSAPGGPSGGEIVP